MFGIGMPEMILILALALIVIGPKKLPDLAKSLGRALGEFKNATSDLKRSMEIEEISEVKKSFDELNQDINQTLQEDIGSTDTSPKASNDTKAAESNDSSDPEQPLDDLKKAFDNYNQDAAPEAHQAPAPEAGASETAGKPDESSPNETSARDDKGSMTNERG
jgi:sec-independent protein translocase protein TatB